MQFSSPHSPSNLAKIPLSRKCVAAEGTYFCPCLTHLWAFPLPRGCRPVPHFGSVVQLSPKSRADTDFRLGLSGFYLVCSWETTEDPDHTASVANFSTACGSWWKSLSRYLIWTSVKLIHPPSALHSRSLPSLFLYWFICLSCWSLCPVTCGIFSAVNIFNQLDQSIIIVQHLKPRQSWMGIEMPISLMRCK